MIEISDVVRRKASVAGADEWLRTLPELVDSLCRDWDLTVETTLDDSTEAVVLAVTHELSTPAVLKLCIPRDGDAARHEVDVLAHADGVGCAALLRWDVPLGAMLIERLGRSLHELDLPIAQRHEILCATVSPLWHRAPELDLPSGAEKGSRLIEFIGDVWERTGRPCSEQAVTYAFGCAERRIDAHDDERAVLVHGDVHEWNTLELLDRTGYKLIDPDGLLAEPEYDLGIIMREDPVELMHGDPRDRSRWLAKRTGLDETAIWEWGVVERVSTGLLCAEIGLQPVGRHMLHAAEQIAVG